MYIKSVAAAGHILYIISLCGMVVALDNGLALTPPMGWMHWERFRCVTNCSDDPYNCLTEDLIMEQAKMMATEGYRDAGYQYVSVDDCWMAKSRDKNGKLQADPDRFPNGMKALGDYIHSLGLKFGIYEDFGTKTCMGYPGSEFYLWSDAETFAEWGVDLLKLDGCNSHVEDMKIGYAAMGEFLNLTNRPILYLCSWPAYIYDNKKLTDYTAFKKVCNQWRNYYDIQDSWKSLYGIIDYYGDDHYQMSEFAGPGGWNDPDELIIGNYGLSYTQERVQMGMWAMMASPLFMSVDLKNIRDESKALYLNKYLIGVNQDPKGMQGIRLWKEGVFEAWIKFLSEENTAAIAIINHSDFGLPGMLKISLENVGLQQVPVYSLMDAFTGTVYGSFHINQTISIQVDPTGIFMAIARPSSIRDKLQYEPIVLK